MRNAIIPLVMILVLSASLIGGESRSLENVNDRSDLQHVSEKHVLDVSATKVPYDTQPEARSLFVRRC